MPLLLLVSRPDADAALHSTPLAGIMEIGAYSRKHIGFKRYAPLYLIIEKQLRRFVFF